ncbi:MATH and LRR domain-containing protein PFE0570w-like, partial [Aphis craccivora]
MNVKQKILPVICLVSAYVHWIKPRLLSASASKSGKSLLLNLCGRSRFFIPMMVFTAFWLFDTHLQIEATISFTFSRNVQINIGAPEEELEVDLNDDDDDDDDDGVDDSIDSYSDISSSSDVSLIALEDLHVALEE